EPARHALGVENDGRGHHRAGERSPPGLVAARDRPDAALERGALAAEGRTDVLLAERQAEGTNRCDALPQRTTPTCAAVRRATACSATVCLATHGGMVRAAGRKSTAAQGLV